MERKALESQIPTDELTNFEVIQVTVPAARKGGSRAVCQWVRPALILRPYDLGSLLCPTNRRSSATVNPPWRFGGFCKSVAYWQHRDGTPCFFREAVLMMELPKRHAASLEG
jgi:hypothetical protein